MKSILNVSKTVFLGLGAVIGAGFISGAEPISFFGLNGFVPLLILSFFLFIFSFYLVLFAGKCCDGYEGVKKRVFSDNKLINAFLFLSLFITFSAMLSVVDEILFITILNKKIKIFSLVLIAILPFIVKGGIRFIEKVNLFFSPVILFLSVYLFATKKAFEFSFTVENPIYLIKSFLFVFSNTFLTMPVLADSAIKKSRGEIILSSVILSILLCAVALFVLASIKKARLTEKNAFPFLISIGKEYKTVFSSLLIISVFTSLFLSFYPLFNFSYSRGKGVGALTLLTFSYCFSRLGVVNIIDYAYPVIGVFGLIATVFLAKFKITKKYKNPDKDHNTEKGVKL